MAKASGTKSTKKRFWPWAALAGLVSAAAFLAVAELVALLVGPGGSPVLAVGSFVIDIVPRWAKEFAIETFGANDKLFLLLSLAVAVVVAAAVAGVAEYIRRPVGAVILGLAGVIAVAATVTRSGASPLVAIPSVLGAVVGILLISLLIPRLRAWREGVVAAGSTRSAGDIAATSAKKPAGVGRRGFLRLTAIAGAASIVVGVGSRVVSVATSSIGKVRDALKLPKPDSTVALPDGAELDVPGVSSLVTANKDFYRVDTALTVPSVDPETWTLTIEGMVGKKVTLTFDDLVKMGLDEYMITLTCVSNEVGGSLLGNAVWQGVPIRDVLALAKPEKGADMVLSSSVDGFTASTPIGPLTDPKLDAILAVAMNGEPLPLEHGFPVRMLVPGLYGYVSATKWLSKLKVTTFEKDEAYWTPRGYSAEAPIKLSSRIDTPRIDKAIAAGPTKIAGMAWAQPVGVGTVEVQIDNGDWQKATMSTPVNGSTWVQWFLDWDAQTGTHYIAVRTTDVNGTVQTEERAAIAPNGSSGLQRTLIRVT